MDYGELTGLDSWFRYHMPYNFVRLVTGKNKHTYLPVNRNYKPLGYMHDDFVNYEDYRGQAVIFKSDPLEFKNVWYTTKLFMYHDNPKSREDYFQRLERLMRRAWVNRLESEKFGLKPTFTENTYLHL